MSNIDRDLISNKSNCYVFDIDGCLADVHEILLTCEQTYKIELAKYEENKIIYNNRLRLYEEGKLEIHPELPVEPIRPSESKMSEIDWNYFRDHIIDAIPIQGILNLFISVALTYKTILLTGRKNINRPQTIEWLKKVIIEKGGDDLFRRINFQLIMRNDKEENLSGAKYKRAKIIELSKQYNIQLVVEDCPEIISELTSLGILVLSPNREYYRIGQE